MIVNKHITKDNWNEIKDILPQITKIRSLNLSIMGLIEFPKMSHITIMEDFKCWNNKISSFENCPNIGGDFNCSSNKLKSFKDCPVIGCEFDCSSNQIVSFENCPPINGRFYCHNNLIKSFKDCPIANGDFYSGVLEFNKIHKYSREKKISLLEAQVELYNHQDEEILAHIDKFPDLVAYIRLNELNKLLVC